MVRKRLPEEWCRELTTEAKQLMGYIADHHDNLPATLTDNQKEILEKFDVIISLLLTIHCKLFCGSL